MVDKNNSFKYRLGFYCFAYEVVNTQDQHGIQILFYGIYRWEMVSVTFDLEI